MPVSLRVVISVVSALSVAVVAAITLSITLTSSLAALRTVGTGQSEALLRSAQISSENLFAAPQDSVATLQNISRSFDWPWPANDASARQQWSLLAEALLLEGQSSLDSILLYFQDDTFVRVGFRGDQDRAFVIPAPYQMTAVTFASPATNISIPRATPNRTAMPPEFRLVHTDNRSVIPQSDPLFERVMPPFVHEFDSTTGTWDNTLMLATVNGASDVNAGVFSVAFFGQVQNFIPFMGAMYRPGERRGIDQPYAFAVAAMKFLDLNAFLRASRATPGTLAVAIDRSGFMFASSADRSFETPAEIVPRGTSPPPGCTTTEAAGTVSADPNNYLSCRIRATEYGFDILNSVMADPALAFTPTRTVQLVNAPDGVYFAGAAPVRMKFRGSTAHLLLMIPEADVIGDVVRSRNVAIGVTCAVFVIVAALTFVAITLLLAPLGTIAERMQRAADFDDDDTDESVSAMAEVAALQRAYYEMNDELKRIRSFVPQSVLVAKRHDQHADDDDDEGELDTDDHTGSAAVSFADTKSTRSHRSIASHGSKPPGGIAASSAAATGVVTKSVAVLVANAAGFSAAFAAQGSSATAMSDMLSALVERVEQAVSGNGGVLGNFHGDHFTATFNAVSFCGAAARRACAAACALTDTDGAAASRDAAPPLKIGIAAGKCLVGNVGTAAAKTFSVVGPAFTQAVLLERFSRLYGPTCDVLVTKRVAADVSTQYRFRYVDHVLLPPRQPTLIAALQGPITVVESDNAGAGSESSPNDEWLYVVNQHAASDPNAAHNALFQCLADGDLEGARQLQHRMAAAHDDATPPTDVILLDPAPCETHDALPALLKALENTIASAPDGAQPNPHPNQHHQHRGPVTTHGRMHETYLRASKK